MFSLVRSTVASPTLSSTTKHALAASTSAVEIASTSPMMASHSPRMPSSPSAHGMPLATIDGTMPTKRLQGGLFGPVPLSSSKSNFVQGMGAPSHCMPSSSNSQPHRPLLRQAFSTGVHVLPAQTFTPPSPTFSFAPSSPKMPAKSCLKSPKLSGPITGIKSPRFTSSGMTTAKSREGPLFDKGIEDVTRGFQELGLPAMKEREAVPEVEMWKSARARVPTPFSPRTGWLDSPGADTHSDHQYAGHD